VNTPNAAGSKPAGLDPATVLATPLSPNDAEAATVGDYLRVLLSTLWQEEDGFSGKRPFGNSGWKFDVYLGLMTAGHIDGELDEDGYVARMDEAAGDALIFQAIATLGSGELPS